MKKMISMVMALVLCFALAGTALADFTPSVSYKPAPELAGPTADDGCRIVGYVTKDGVRIGEIHYNSNGHMYATVEAVHENGCNDGHRCLIMTPLSMAEDDKEIPEDARDLLLWVYEQIMEKGMSFIKNAELDAYIKEQLGADKTVEDLVVRDLFDVSVLCEELNEYLEPTGSVVCMDFDLGLEPGSFVAVVVYKDGQWQMIENAEVLEDGSVTCTTFEHFCPVAILVADAQSDSSTGGTHTGTPAAGGGSNGSSGGSGASTGGYVPASTDAPDTGVSANNNLVLWIVIAAAALAAIVVLVAVQSKRKKQ